MRRRCALQANRPLPASRVHHPGRILQVTKASIGALTMLIRDPRFVSALGLTVAQQLLLAFSTYSIAQAGIALADGNIDGVLRDISLFFGSALLAYVTSSVASLLTARAANRIWHRSEERRVGKECPV